MPPEQPDDALTYVTRRPQPTSTNKTLAILLGFAGALAPAITGYFAYRQAKIEAAAETKAVRSEASVGYRTLADPVELLTAFSKSHETRIQTLEAEIRECALRQSINEPPVVQPPPPSLLRALPKTLGEANALAQ
jgi:hypothetical protein